MLNLHCNPMSPFITLVLQMGNLRLREVTPLARPWQSREGGGRHSPSSHSPDLLPSSGSPCCPSHPARKAPTYGFALEHLGVEVAELHVGQGSRASTGPGPHAGVHGGHPLQQPEDTAVTLERVPAEVPGARSRGGASTWLPLPPRGHTPCPLSRQAFRMGSHRCYANM